jgi:hypothetical protein
MVMIGKNVAPGVTGGDVPAAASHVSAARTLGAVLGIPDSVMSTDFVAAEGGAGGKIVTAAVAST